MALSFGSAISTGELPKEIWLQGLELYNWEGFWYSSSLLSSAIAARSNFQAREDDVFLTSSMKIGTTWLKAIIPTIMNPNGRTNNNPDEDPLLKHHPNDLMPSMEIQVFNQPTIPNLTTLSSPRLFRTHVPYPMLPESVKNSACKIVYITRDPKDTFVSLWHFLNSCLMAFRKDPCPLDEAFQSFCKGVHPFGPFHDHVLGFWEESLRRPEKILFLRYEDMKKDPKEQVKKLASFLGRPFEDEAEVDMVLWKFSLEVNQNGVDPLAGINYKFYFRNGNVGDWKNDITEEMKEKLDQLTKLKFEGSGLDY